MTQMKSVQWVEYYLGSILLQYRKYLTLTSYIWPWPFSLTFDLNICHGDLETDLLLPWCFEENITKMYFFDVTWRKNTTSYVRTETNLPISILSVNILQPTRSLCDFRFQSYGSKGDISRLFDLSVFTLCPCMNGVIFEGICSLLAEIYNIEIWKNSLYFIMGIFRCHGNVRYVFLIDAIFCKVHSLGPNNMCIKFEKNRLRIDDFRKSEKIVCFLWRHVAQKRDVVCPNRVHLAAAPFDMERFPINRKSLRLPVQKLWPIMWFLQKWWPWPWP